MKKYQIIFVCFLAFIMFSCSSTKKTTSSTPAAAIETIAPPEGKAMIYIVRPQFVGLAINFKVFIDGTPIGVTKGKTYIYAAVTPGKHTILSQAENKEELDIVFEQGKTYYFEQVPQMGIVKARNKIVKLEEPDAKEKLGKCKLAKDFKPNF